MWSFWTETTAWRTVASGAVNSRVIPGVVSSFGTAAASRAQLNRPPDRTGKSGTRTKAIPRNLQACDFRAVFFIRIGLLSLVSAKPAPVSNEIGNDGAWRYRN